MSTITGTQILERAWIKAQDDGDTGPVRWKEPEALKWLNDGQREVVNIHRAAYTLTAVRPVLAGCRQTLAGLGLPQGIQVVEVLANYGTDLTTVGRALRLQERKHLDEFRPQWRSDVADEASAFMLAPDQPEAFDIHPAVPAGRGLQVVYASLPPDLTTAAQLIALSDVYANALQFFVLASFYLKDTTFTAAPAKAAFYMQAFAQSLGVKRDNTLLTAATAIAASNAKGAQ